MGRRTTIREAQDDPGAHAGRRTAEPLRHHGDDPRRLAARLVPVDRAGDELAVIVAPGDIRDDGGGQGARGGEALARPLDGAFLLELGEEVLERDLVGARKPELARDLTFADPPARSHHESEDFVAGWKPRLLGGRGLRGNGFVPMNSGSSR